MSTFDRVIEVLKSVSETEEVQKNPDLALYDLQVLDSKSQYALLESLHFFFVLQWC